MKSHTIILALAVSGLTSPLSSQADDTLSEVTIKELEALGPLPTSREVIQLEPKEHNPFAVRIEEKKEVANEDSESEESRLRKLLNKLTVKGTIFDGTRYKIMLGSMVLKEGDILKNLVAGQTSLLRVSRIDHRMLEISWIESDEASGQRKYVRPIVDNSKLVRSEMNTGAEGEEKLIIMVNGKGDNFGALPPKEAPAVEIEPDADQPREEGVGDGLVESVEGDLTSPPPSKAPSGGEPVTGPGE